MDLCTSPAQDTIHTFDGFEVDEALFELRKDGRKIELQRRAFDLLVHLVRHRDRVVTTSELLASVWKGTIVCENAIAQAVTTLRKRLDLQGGPSAIRTSRGRGYRFVRDVSGTTQAPPASERHPTSSRSNATSTPPGATVIVMSGDLPEGTLDAVMNLLRERTGREPRVTALDDDARIPAKITADRASEPRAMVA